MDLPAVLPAGALDPALVVLQHWCEYHVKLVSFFQAPRGEFWALHVARSKLMSVLPVTNAICMTGKSKEEKFFAYSWKEKYELLEKAHVNSYVSSLYAIPQSNTFM